MVELICRNEPKHFFCLYNILKLFRGAKEVDVRSVYHAMKKRKCIAFKTKYCPVSFNNEPCTLLRGSHDSIIREQLYALEALNFIQRKRDSRKLLFQITRLGRKAVKFMPKMLPPEDISDGEIETDLTADSSQRWIQYCREGLSTYGPFVGYLWKIKCGKSIDHISDEIGDRAVNTFDLWARECDFKKNNSVIAPDEFFVKKIRIRNWVTRKFRNEPPHYQEKTTEVLFRLKRAKVTNGSVDLSKIRGRWEKIDILLNIENTGVILDETNNLINMKNDFDLDDYTTSIRDLEFRQKLFKLFDAPTTKLIEEEIGSEKIEFKLDGSKDEEKTLLDFIRQRSKENKQKTPAVSRVKGKRLERDYELYGALKRFYGYRCQVDKHTFRKKDGGHYCEVAHIKPFATSKDDTEDNILILCANCHRKLDFGNEEIRKEILGKVGKL